nr:MAG TPA: hypothetical protein [Caudoviricetes sp.]
MLGKDIKTSGTSKGGTESVKVAVQVKKAKRRRYFLFIR